MVVRPQRGSLKSTPGRRCLLDRYFSDEPVLMSPFNDAQAYTNTELGF